MLRLVSANAGATDEPQLPPLMMAIFRTINRTFGADLDALASDSAIRLAALEAGFASMHRRLLEVEALHIPRDISNLRFQRAGLPEPLLNDAERRLREGIELEVIAEGFAVTPEELGRQLIDRADNRSSRLAGRG